MGACASKRTTATGGAAPKGSTTTADGLVHGSPHTDNSGNVTTETRQDDVERLNNATQVFAEVMAEPDKAIPQELLDRA